MRGYTGLLEEGSEFLRANALDWHRVEWDAGGMWAHVAYVYATPAAIKRRWVGLRLMRVVRVRDDEVCRGLVVEVSP